MSTTTTDTASSPLEQAIAIAQDNPVAIISLVVALMVTYFIYQKITMTQARGASSDAPFWAEHQGAPSSQPKSAATTTLKNIWDSSKSRRQQQAGKKAHTGDKPFGSKYYYAHNNPGATGGYKDGLQMEDYTMNGPRLLSKGGKKVEGQTEDDNTEDAVDPSATPASSSTATKPPRGVVSSSGSSTSQDPSIRPLTKYLWDDPGDWNGMATIRIDHLPKDSRTNSELVPWKDVNVQNVDARLVGEGLLVHVDAQDENGGGNVVRYQLKISKLYGDAASVKPVIHKANKRLLIRIFKKKNAVLANREENANLEAWPQPHRKI